ncbi:uncharacterized protein si:ch211-57n23.1 isoform X2 [Hippoglossus stenolepis]|uniref:uncharacterized protein si:ch211-57n23.1 isoform X2 n=1 Tax=Hippoglossus stenolepis TaxID=195615 RepID=UPI00159C1685|nr:uncharacterized protein si:ch211-57n23.1 isoform X2 [Hippoglossus stenolepis]
MKCNSPHFLHRLRLSHCSDSVSHRMLRAEFFPSNLIRNQRSVARLTGCCCSGAGVFFASLEMLQGAVSRAVLCLSCCLLLGVCLPAEAAGPAGAPPNIPPEEESGESYMEDLEWGSGSSLLQLLHSFPADSPFVTETPGKPVNCSQRFWLPPSSAVCWENVAGPEEFARSRLQLLQNRASLQAVSTSSGVEEGGFSYDHQAKEEVQGVYSDHLSMAETMQTMEKVFVSLEEKRKEGKEQGVLTNMREHLSNTRDTIDVREHMANHLEQQFSTLEKTLINMQLRLSKLIRQ